MHPPSQVEERHVQRLSASTVLISERLLFAQPIEFLCGFLAYEAATIGTSYDYAFASLLT
jgi:hypothetical protein